MNNLGWDEAKAKRIENAFNTTYQVSIDWVNAQLNKAVTTGYVELAFGLRLHTPGLYNSDKIKKSHKILEEQKRSAGNALGQSYGLLNNRAVLAFFNKVIDSPYADKIHPSVYIHDANYWVWDNSPEITHWINQNLINEMKWQDLPDIRHDTVKLGAELDLFYPTWKDKTTLKNDYTFNDVNLIHKELFNG